MAVAAEAMQQIVDGAFLTVKAEDALNTMTIGWATIGYIWNKPIMLVAVRLIRHTFGIIEQADDFTVSIPSTDMAKELDFCGTRSGRDVDKFEACRLPVAPAQRVGSPIIAVPGLHYECRIVYKTAMGPAHLSPELAQGFYAAEDYHTLYFGEIVDCYRYE
jgi:flavin reductase (DIM6/NTAB) family NADH-FMN oxidoreductase RutF